MDYLKRFYDVDENKKYYSVTETGIKALIAWNKIHGFEDKLGVNMAYLEPISDDEMSLMFSEFKKNMESWSKRFQNYKELILKIYMLDKRKFYINGQWVNPLVAGPNSILL